MKNSKFRAWDEQNCGAYSTFKYKGALMIVDYFQKSDSWQCMDAKFTIKGRGRTRMGAICDSQNQWDEYLKKMSCKELLDN